MLRLAMSKIVRTAMALVAVLIALPLVGQDITALSVFGGALGAGIGLGLQKVAANYNYTAGFTILLDRSVSPGDLVTVDGFYGEVTKLTSRCVVVRGTEAIIPNKTLVTSPVINQAAAISSTACLLLCEVTSPYKKIVAQGAPGCCRIALV